jgi:hypothetical protein
VCLGAACLAVACRCMLAVLLPAVVSACHCCYHCFWLLPCPRCGLVPPPPSSPTALLRALGRCTLGSPIPSSNLIMSPRDLFVKSALVTAAPLRECRSARPHRSLPASLITERRCSIHQGGDFAAFLVDAVCRSHVVTGEVPFFSHLPCCSYPSPA